jgi:ketosteroid isomerase-like protein
VGEIYNKGDAAAMTALYTSDAALLPQGSDQPIIGEANIRKFFDDWFNQRLENAQTTELGGPFTPDAVTA